MKYLFNFLFAVIIITSAYAQPGTLDSSFGDAGKVIGPNYYAYVYATTIQQDGKIIACGGGSYGNQGGFLLIRYNPDGSVDSSFGTNGAVVTDFSGPIDEAYGVVVQPDGKILAAGQVGRNIDAGVIRYLPNGDPDSSFGVNGIAVTELLGGDDYVSSMALQQDGKILVTGMQGTRYAFVIRYLPDGSLDNGFGDNGKQLTFFDREMEINSVAVQGDGKILIGGIADRLYSSSKFLIIRYLSDDSLDEAFGEAGIVKATFPNYKNTKLYSIALQDDNKIVAAGGTTLGYDEFMALARFESNGIPDLLFGNEGKVITDFNRQISETKTVLLQPDGKIVAIGSAYDYIGINGVFALARYKTDGSLDSSFGTNGLQTTAVGDNARGNAAAMQPDGKIVIVGDTYISGQTYSSVFCLARYNGGKLNNLPEFAKIQKWQGHYGFTWNSWPGNKTTYYSVGRSTNASSFTEIAQVTDIPKQKKYKFEDPNPLSGIVYYRLTAVRTDGVMVNSNIITCGNDAGFIQLYPNPAKNSLHIEGLSATEKTKLSILDFSGYAKLVTTATGNSYNFNIAQLKPGNYMLVIETKGNVVTKKFVKEQ